MARTHKAKQYLFGLAKFLVLSISFGYIFYRLQQHASQDFISFLQPVLIGNKNLYLFLFILITLTSINWIFEILKWKNLVKTIQKIDFILAAKQTFAALTVSLATPGRIGDYGAKALFFKKENRKRILLLNLFSNLAQLFTTTIFGIIGIVFCVLHYKIPISGWRILILIIGVILILFSIYFFRNKEWKGFSIDKLILFFKRIPFQIKINVLVFSVIRYLTFSSMFYGLLLFFGADIPVFTAFQLIFTTYLLVSVLPSILIFDVVIRGGIALWLFSFEGVSEYVVLSSVFFMWFFNFVLPSLIGSIYVVKFQPVIK